MTVELTQTRLLWGERKALQEEMKFQKYYDRKEQDTQKHLNRRQDNKMYGAAENSEMSRV
jgi:hypothetical protein